MLTNHATFFGYTYGMEQAEIVIFGAPFDSTTRTDREHDLPLL